MQLKNINSLSYEDLIDNIFKAFIKEFGERKFKKVLTKIMTSNKISGLISKARFAGIAPGSSDILYCLNEIPYFIFSNGQTQLLAALIALQRWNEEVNSIQLLLNEDGLKLRAQNIIHESKITFN